MIDKFYLIKKSILDIEELLNKGSKYIVAVDDKGISYRIDNKEVTLLKSQLNYLKEKLFKQEELEKGNRNARIR